MSPTEDSGRSAWQDRQQRLHCYRIPPPTAGRTLVLTCRGLPSLFIEADEIVSLEAQGLCVQRLKVRLTGGRSHILARRWYFEWADAWWEDEMAWCADISHAIARSLGLTATVVTDDSGDFHRLEMDRALEERAG